MDAKRRTFLAIAAAVPTTGCTGILTRGESDDQPTASGTRSLAPDDDPTVRVVLEEVDESVPLLSGVVVNFGDRPVNAEAVVEFYREIDGVREIVSTRKTTVAGVYPKRGAKFEIPFPTDEGPEQGVRYDLAVEVTAVFD